MPNGDFQAIFIVWIFIVWIFIVWVAANMGEGVAEGIGVDAGAGECSGGRVAKRSLALG